MLPPDIRDIMSRMPPGEFEAMAGATMNATSFGTMAQSSHAKEVKEAFLEPGASAADMIMRGALEDDQIGPAVRVACKELWLVKEMEGTLPKGLEDIADYPLGFAGVLLQGSFQAAAKGNARSQALAGFTGGILAFEGGGGAFRKKARGLFGKNDRDAGVIQ